MIVMLNGSFGVGKTSTARALVKAMPDSLIFDPEMIGYVLRRMPGFIRGQYMPTDNYQDAKLWRRLTIRSARLLYALRRRTLIVPMTLVNPDYLLEIRRGLEGISPPLHHFCLTAPLETIQARLRGRGDDAGSWSWHQAIDIAPRFADSMYAEHIDTQQLTITQVAEYILSRL